MERRAVRCAIYTRQSVARPSGADFTSCDAQRDACLALVRAHAPEGWIPIVERFDDAGESGATTDRPALTRLLDQIASGGVDCVVVHRLDRLTRSVADWARLAGAFKRRGTKLVVVAGDLHLGDLAMSDLVLNVLATFAQFEREIIGERLRDARAGLRRRGLRNAGRIPFGYKADPLSHQLVVQPAEAPVVKRMFEMAAACTPPSAIAMWINTQGEDNPRVLDGRQPWSPKAVLRVLGNRTYLGRMGHVDDAHDPIIDEDLFARARAAVDRRRTRQPRQRAQQEGDLFLLRRLLRCIHCDRLMTTSSSRALPETPIGRKPSKIAPPPRYYRCRGPKSCPGSQISADDIEQRVLAWLRKPTGTVSPEALTVLTSYSTIWAVLFPENVRRAVAQLVWEVQWDGPKNKFTVMLDETAIAEAHSSIARRDQERSMAKAAKHRPRKRGKRGKRA
jgi:site-specific DNA recombinase